MADSKQCSDAAQKGPGLKPAVSRPNGQSAPAVGTASNKTSPNSSNRGKQG